METEQISPDCPLRQTGMVGIDTKLHRDLGQLAGTKKVIHYYGADRAEGMADFPELGPEAHACALRRALGQCIWKYQETDPTEGYDARRYLRDY